MFSYLLVALSSFCGFNLLHGDLHERIQKISAEIAESPDSALLYLKRGELYFQHELYDSSKMDFVKCETLGNYPKSRFYFEFAKTLNILDEDKMAIYYLQEILKIDPYNVNALRLSGKIYLENEEYCKAGIYLESVIANTNTTLPFNYLEASRAYQGCQDKFSYEKSIIVLENGIKILGPIVTFYNELISICENNEDYVKAIYYQTLIVESSKRKEFSLFKRAKLYLAYGEKDKAKEDLIESLKCIDQLPSRIKQNKATNNLTSKIQALLSKS